MFTTWKLRVMAAIIASWGFIGGVSAQPRALLFDDGPISFDFRQALMDEGVYFRRALNWMQFEAYLEEEPYDLVVVSVQMARHSDWTALIDYVNSGRPAIVTYFDLLHSPELAAAFECNVTASLDDEVVSSIVQSYAHPIWAGLSGRLDLELKGAIDNGDIIAAAGTAEVVGEFESGGGAIVIGNGGRTIVNAFLTNDAVTTANAVQLARNEIGLMLQQIPPYDPFVVTSTADKGCGSLRKAITEANNAAGAVTITFNIPPSDPNYNGGAPKIMPPKPLPEMTGTGITIDGATQPGFDPAGGKMVVISGEAAFGGDGLTIRGDGNAVRDLVVNGFRAGGRGLCIKGDNSVVTGCRVGTDPTGTIPAPNAIGIRVIGSASNNLVGEDNVIAFNTSHGVALYSSATGNTIRGNSIFSNGGKGISFWGSSGAFRNDAGDADAGPNKQQNHPEVCGVLLAGGDLSVTFAVDSDTAYSAYPLTVDVYLADADDEEGEVFLGSVTYLENEANQKATRTITPLVAVVEGDRLVTTATSADGNTSEFSPPVAVSTADCDEDGVADSCSADSDGDGVIDPCDICPGFDDHIDTDGDGIPDGCDPCIESAPSPYDLDGDCDIDTSDFAWLQRCLTGPTPLALLFPDGSCDALDFNADGYVDHDDVALMRQCTSGPAIPPDPLCSGSEFLLGGGELLAGGDTDGSGSIDDGLADAAEEPGDEGMDSLDGLDTAGLATAVSLSVVCNPYPGPYVNSRTEAAGFDGQFVIWTWIEADGEMDGLEYRLRVNGGDDDALFRVVGYAEGPLSVIDPSLDGLGDLFTLYGPPGGFAPGNYLARLAVPVALDAVGHNELVFNMSAWVAAEAFPGTLLGYVVEPVAPLDEGDYIFTAGGTPATGGEAIWTACPLHGVTSNNQAFTLAIAGE